MKKIKNGILFGVCGGIGKSLGIGIDTGEIIGIILMLFTDWFWWVYILLAIFMSEEDEYLG